MVVWNWIVDTTAGWSTLGVAMRLFLALIVGLVVGIDRELKRRGAGIKTHVLVCVGAAAVMITSEYLMVKFGGDLDISRMGAQVISGVGFLGVGTIIVTGRNQVRIDDGGQLMGMCLRRAGGRRRLCRRGPDRPDPFDFYIAYPWKIGRCRPPAC